jgi:two-component system response regulator AlgR
VEIVGDAANGRDAVEAVARLSPDLVLLDIRMPLMDGIEAARHIAGFENAPAVIFCTAFDGHALAAFDANAVDYLVKPIRLERLKAAIARAQRFTGAALQRAKRRRRSLTPSAATRARACAAPATRADRRDPVPDGEDKYVVVHHAKRHGSDRRGAQGARNGIRGELRAHPPQLPWSRATA